MTRPFPLRFELPSPAKQLRVERVIHHTTNSGVVTDRWGNQYEDKKEHGYWRLWLMANADFTLGTFIQLLDNGMVNRVTWHEDGTETVLEVTDDNDSK